MTIGGLSPREIELIREVLRRHAEIRGAILFGSRAKGTSLLNSDIDLALEGDFDPLRAEAIAAELDALPLPYQFDVRSLSHLEQEALRRHIERVGIQILD